MQLEARMLGQPRLHLSGFVGAERVAPHLRDREFEVGDLRVEIEGTSFGFLGTLLRRGEQRLQRRNVVGCLGQIVRHGYDGICFDGCRECPGINIHRQSRPRHTSSGNLGPVGLLRSSPVDPLQHVAQLGR